MSDTLTAETRPAAADFLYGTKAIGEFLGIRERQAEHLIYSGVLPAFKVGKTVCARRARILEAFERLEEGE